MIGNLRVMARALNGEVMGGHVSCPGPGHGSTDRSLRVYVSASSPDGFMAHSFAGDDWRDCRDHVADLLGLDRERGNLDRAMLKPQPAPKPKGEAAREAFILQRVAEVVRGLRPIAGTPGEDYLREVRKIDTSAIADVLSRPDAVGWHPRCLFRQDGHRLDGDRLGCVVGIMKDPVTAKPTGGISRTYIHEGAKVAKAKGLGPAGVVRLTPDEEVFAGLHIAEGLETALDVMARDYRPMWSTGSTSIMSTLPVLTGVEALTIFADHDENGVGERAARDCAGRWLAAGRETRAIKPRVPGDFNDLSMGRP